MKRAKESPDWVRFIGKVYSEGYEVISRLGNPIVMHKTNTPFARETVWFCFFRKKNGKFSAHQKKGMEIFEALGLHVFRWPEK